MNNEELWVSSLPGIHATQLNLVYLTTGFAAPQPPSAIYSGELWQAGQQAQLYKNKCCMSCRWVTLLAALRPACQCSLAVLREQTFPGAQYYMWSTSVPGRAAAEQLPRVRSGSFIRPAGPQEKQSSSHKHNWHESWDHIKSGPFAAAFYQQQTSF